MKNEMELYPIEDIELEDISLVGPKGEQGPKGDKGDQGPKGDQGKDGANGSDGYSPIANVTQTSMGATITIIDKNGKTTANVHNGKDSEPYDDTKIKQNILELEKITGHIDNLETENKDNLVNAINEVTSKVGNINTILETLVTVKDGE